MRNISKIFYIFTKINYLLKRNYIVFKLCSYFEFNLKIHIVELLKKTILHRLNADFNRRIRSIEYLLAFKKVLIPVNKKNNLVNGFLKLNVDCT